MKPPPVEGAPETPEDKRPAPGEVVTFAEQLSTLPPPPPRKVSKKPASTRPGSGARRSDRRYARNRTARAGTWRNSSSWAGRSRSDNGEGATRSSGDAGRQDDATTGNATTNAAWGSRNSWCSRSSRRGRGANSPCGAGTEDHPAHAHLRDSWCGSQRSKRSALRAHRGTSQYHPGRAGRSQSGEHRESYRRRVVAGRRDGGGRLAHVQRLQGRCARGAAERKPLETPTFQQAGAALGTEVCFRVRAVDANGPVTSSRARYPNRPA